MLHSKRRWCVRPVASAEELARKLTTTTWCLCDGFELGGYRWLNDATSPGCAQEYGVIRSCADGTLLQIESITFSWCDYDEALRYIQGTLNGDDDNHDFLRVVRLSLQSPEQHDCCEHCA